MGKPVTMTENRLAIRRAFLDGKINAVCGYPGMKQFINEDNDGNIETNHSDGRA